MIQSFVKVQSLQRNILMYNTFVGTEQKESFVENVTEILCIGLRIMVISKGVLLEWYRIRDLWIGMNHTKQNRILALELAEKCKHPEAKSICDGKVMMIYMFNNLTGEGDQMILFQKYVKKEAKNGHPFAQAVYASKFLSENRDKQLKYAKKSTEQGERDGLAILGHICYFQNHKDIASRLFLRAAKLGSKYAMKMLGNNYWIGKSGLDEKCKIYYQNQLIVYRKMVDMWTLVAKRLGVVKDIRRLIGKMIWKQRKYIEAPREGIWEMTRSYLRWINL